MLGDALIRWTARLFVACYVGRLCIDATGRRDESTRRVARGLWSLGCGLCLLHVAVAFHFQHGWSHAAALEHVRHRTLRDIGWDSGIGLYVNYAFTLLWLVDVMLWWRRLDRLQHRRTYWSVQLVFAFLMSQATAGFGPTFWKPITLIVAVVLIVIRMRSARSNNQKPSHLRCTGHDSV